MTVGLTVILRTVFPCCGGPSRIAATLFVPRETCSRTCPRCGTSWTVERRLLSDPGAGVGTRYDSLDWIEVPLVGQ